MTAFITDKLNNSFCLTNKSIYLLKYIYPKTISIREKKYGNTLLLRRDYREMLFITSIL